MYRSATWMPGFVRRTGRQCRQFYKHQTAKVCPCPVLVGGMQKSGTTAIGALLAIATGGKFSNDPFWHAHKFDARPFLFTDLLESRLTLEAFVQRHRAYFSAEIIKDPDFNFLYAALRSRFPGSPQVFIARDPRQNIRSILNRLGLPGDLDELGEEHHRLLAGKEGWQAIIGGLGVAITGGNYVARLAQRWSVGVKCYVEQRSLIELVRYEDFLADKPGCIARLAGRLGLPVVADIRKDQDRQYQPRGDRTVPLDAFFGAKNLAIIESACAKGMAHFRYTQQLVFAVFLVPLIDLLQAMADPI